MFIKDITIDGFKSYCSRTVISGFDPAFNAITGLNGSGKSNILDAVCFVLGISNMSQVRAGKLEELVYKQGQAGTTKASVSITFHNSDTNTSPYGYEQCQTISVTRQVIIGGRNKYLINGKIATAEQVHTLFKSVQLNVNNPHFLIMQGRITKVINMKPKEILSLLEEAAGTRMYDEKKEQTLKTLEKKQAKVDEIDNLLENEIQPAFQRLRSEKEEYTKWANNSDRLQRLRRFCIAYEYTQLRNLAGQGSSGNSALSETVTSLKNQQQSLAEQMEEIDRKIESKESERENEIGQKFQDAKAKVDEVSNELVRANSSWENANDALQSARERSKSLKENVESAQSDGSEKAKRHRALEEKLAELKTERDRLNRAADHAEQSVSGLECGKGTGDAKNLAEQLATAKSNISKAKSDSTSASLKAKHLRQQLEEQKNKLNAKQAEADENKAKLSNLEQEVESAKKAKDEAACDQANIDNILSSKKEMERKVRQAQDKVDSLSSQLSGLDVQFTDPQRGFDRSRIKGPVARLIRVKEPNELTALEVVAGSKLYQLVVDTEETGKLVLEKGNLKRRVTIIPLNKVNSKKASKEVLKRAREVSNGKANVATSLVDFDEDVEKAMSHVFGSSFVCEDSKTAQAVAYDKSIRCVCVTLDGDVHNPAGLLTGGSRSNTSSVLTRLAELSKAENELASCQKELENLSAQANDAERASQKASGLEQEYELKMQNLNLARERLEHSEVQQLTESIDKMTADIENNERREREANEERKEKEKESERIEAEMEASEKDPQKQLEKARKEAEEARSAANEKQKEVQAKETEAKTLEAEVKAAGADEKAMQEQVKEAEEAVEGEAEKVSELLEEAHEKRKQYDEAVGSMEKLKKEGKRTNEEIETLKKDRSSMENEYANKKAEIKKNEHKLSRADKDAKEAKRKMEGLLEENQWIRSEEARFNVANSEYDFEKVTSMEQVQSELNEAEEENRRLSKRVNKNALSLYDRAEREFHELSEKRRTLIRDKEKIERVVSELDDKEKEAINQTWAKVNRDFNSIFSTLLPGSSASLAPPQESSPSSATAQEEDATFLDGLEIKVAFNNEWKASLSELSGGQRSLLALSLILALLLFNPAPVYILDEVDAALDPSHTQNIGRMIRTHFPFAQFIVVSLKEGMFNNANVLFNTKLVDGVSTVSRSLPNGDGENAESSKPNAKSLAGGSKRQRRPLSETQN